MMAHSHVTMKRFERKLREKKLGVRYKVKIQSGATGNCTSEDPDPWLSLENHNQIADLKIAQLARWHRHFPYLEDLRTAPRQCC